MFFIFWVSVVLAVLIPGFRSHSFLHQQELNRHKRCTKVECDATNALSYCGPIDKSCNKGHEETFGICKDSNKKCCRTACGGPLSYCFAVGSECLPGHNSVSGKCPVDGYRCCAPSTL